MNRKSLDELKLVLSMTKRVTKHEITNFFNEKGVKEIHINNYDDREELGIRSIELRTKEDDTTTLYFELNTETIQYNWFNELSLDKIILIYEWLLENKETIKFV